MASDSCFLSWQSPVGELVLGASDGRLCLCDWTGSNSHYATNRRKVSAIVDASPSSRLVVDSAVAQLEEYFRGDRRSFDLPLHAVGTPFQQRVWDALASVSFGATASYSQLAAAIGNPKAVRAVASAVGANPMSIIVPCHRIVGASGSMCGYAGGLSVKQALLELENNYLATQQ